MEVLLPALPLRCLLKTPTGHSLLVCIQCFLYLRTSQVCGGHRETHTLRAPQQKEAPLQWICSLHRRPVQGLEGVVKGLELSTETWLPPTS